MPEYVYRAVTEKGQIVRNRVEDVSKNTLIKRLKSNNLMPISVSQVGYRSVKKHKSRKRNVTDIDDIMRMANSADVMQGRKARDQKISEKYQHIQRTADFCGYGISSEHFRGSEG